MTSFTHSVLLLSNLLFSFKAIEDARLAEIERALAEAKAIEDARLAEIERALKEAARLQAIEDERLATLARLNAM